MLTFCLEGSQNGFNHSRPNALSLASLHEVNVEVRGVVSLKLDGKEKLNIMEISNQLLPGFKNVNVVTVRNFTHTLSLSPPTSLPPHSHTHTHTSIIAHLFW